MPAATHTTIFDASKGYGGFANLLTLVDCTLAKRDNCWQMFVCGVEKTSREIHLHSAALPVGAPLAAAGWAIVADAADPTRPALLAGKPRSYHWDGRGGRHCPAYVQGWDAKRNTPVERIYYAGAAQNYMGPYAIGYVEWDGAQWVDQPEPAFTANCDWEHGSVYEPNVLYHDGRWKMWYVAGANQDDYLVQGYAESEDGRSDWSPHQIVFAADERVFDFCPIATPAGFEAVFSRVNVSQADLPKTGLWWCQARQPSPRMAEWSEPVRISGPGPWKPVPRYSEPDPSRLLVFYDGVAPNPGGASMPSFSLHCLELGRPT